MVANLIGRELLELEVKVTATLDIRVTLIMFKLVPVAFQKMNCKVKFKVNEVTEP